MVCGPTIYLVTQAPHVGVIFDPAPSLTPHFVCSLAAVPSQNILETSTPPYPSPEGSHLPAGLPASTLPPVLPAFHTIRQNDLLKSK